MARIVAMFGIAIVMAASSVGCCTTCHSCDSCGQKRHGYWRNRGLGWKAVGCACCRKCDLCCDVGGPCGAWSQTSLGGEYPESPPRQTRDGSTFEITTPVPTPTSYQAPAIPPASFEVSNAEPSYREYPAIPTVDGR